MQIEIPENNNCYYSKHNMLLSWSSTKYANFTPTESNWSSVITSQSVSEKRDEGI